MTVIPTPSTPSRRGLARSASSPLAEEEIKTTTGSRPTTAPSTAVRARMSKVRSDSLLEWLPKPTALVLPFKAHEKVDSSKTPFVSAVRYVKPPVSPTQHALRPPTVKRDRGDVESLDFGGFQAFRPFEAPHAVRTMGQHDGGQGLMSRSAAITSGSMRSQSRSDRRKVLPALQANAKMASFLEQERFPMQKPTPEANAKMESFLEQDRFPMQKSKPEGPAGVNQAFLNPSIPFSGFPSLAYLRGCAR